MGCCDGKSLKPVKNIEEAIVIAYVDSKMLLLHKEDVASWSSDSDTLIISLKLGYQKYFTREELLNMEDVLNQLNNL